MSLTAKVMPYKQRHWDRSHPRSIVCRSSYAYRWPNPERIAQRTAGRRAPTKRWTMMHKHIGERERIAAIVIMEPIQGEGGFVVPAPGFVPMLAEYARANGIVFVADEIQTGFGRTGRVFAIEHEGVEPDIVTTAKSLAGGLPLAGITGRGGDHGQRPRGRPGGNVRGEPARMRRRAGGR